MARSELELNTLKRISLILGSGMDLEDLFGQAMAVLQEQLGIVQAALVLRDEATGRLRIVAAIGLSDQEMDEWESEFSGLSEGEPETDQ